MRISVDEAVAIRAEVELALEEARAHEIGNSKVDFAAVEIAHRLRLDVSPGSNTAPDDRATRAEGVSSRAGW